ncbi:MAG TPA: choice-of-anchor tandem repeat GloVer-containing protein, partial [Chthoniobacterales bacterium]
YRISPEGTYEELISFDNSNGAQPFGQMIQATDGNFYGTTLLGGSLSNGTVFQLTPAGVLTTVYNFTYSGADGAQPKGTLVQGADRRLYGTTQAGGLYGLGTVFVLDLNLGSPLALLSAASVKGGFAIDLPLTGTPGIEDRRSSAGTYSLTLTFDNNLTSVASVNSSCGTVVSGVIDSTNPHQFIVSLTGVLCNAQDVTVTLTNVQDDQSNTLTSASATMGVLLGDVDGDGSVTMADVALVKASLGQTVNATNFRSDVNPDGVIDHKDLSRTKHSVGSSLP